MSFKSVTFKQTFSMKWLKKHLLIFILSVVGLLLLIDIVIHYWNGWGFTVAETTLFNNLVTPIASIISTIIYTITLLLLIKQTKIIHSDSLKPYFNRRIDNIVRELKNNIYKVPDFSFSFYAETDISYFRLFKFFKEAESKLKLLGMVNWEGKTYYTSIHNPNRLLNICLQAFANHGIGKLDLVRDLILEINSETDLTERERKNLINIIRLEIVNLYVTYIDSISLSPSYFCVPMGDSKTEYGYSCEPFFKTKISKHYDFFIKHVYPERVQ